MANNDNIPHANPNKPRSARHRAREFALQGLYQWLLNTENIHTIKTHMHQIPGFIKADKEHFDALLCGTANTAEALREDLSPFIDRPIRELSPIEHTVLLMSAFELKNHLEIPYRVIINEAVELTKSFGGIDGHKYVNGVLDKLANALRKDERQHEK